VISSPDAPILTLQELNLIDSSAGSLQWWVYDADGIIPDATEIRVNGSILENLSHSCVYDSTDFTNRCLSMLPLPPYHNGSIEVRVSVFDEEIGSETVAYISVNLTASQPGVEQPPTDESNGLESLSVTLLSLGGIVVIVVLIGIVVMLQLKGSKNYTELPIVEVEEEQIEPSPVSRSGGLLARAQQKQ